MSKLDDVMTVKLPSELKRKAYRLAEAEGTEGAEIVRRALEAYVDDLERKYRALASVFAESGR